MFDERELIRQKLAEELGLDPETASWALIDEVSENAFPEVDTLVQSVFQPTIMVLVVQPTLVEAAPGRYVAILSDAPFWLN